MKPWKPWQRVGIVAALLVLVGSLAFVAHPSIAHASGTPTIEDTQTDTCFSSCDGTSSASIDPSVGEEIVVMLSWGGGNSWSPSVEDTASTTFYSLANAGDALGDSAQMWGGFVGQSGSDSVSTALTEECSPVCYGSFVQTHLTVVVLSGANDEEADSGSVSLAENGGGGTTHTASSPGLGTSGDDLDLGMYLDPADKTISVPSGETEFGTNDSPSANIGFDQAYATTQSSFEFDTSGNSLYDAEVAASFAEN